MDALQIARAEIDKIDAEMAELFAARMEVVRRIGAIKRERGLPVLDAAREQDVLERNLVRLEDPALRPLYAEVLRAVMTVSRAFQETVALQP